MVNKIAQFRVFSSIDLRSAHYQIPKKDEDKPYTAFESDGSLYQFMRVPFGVTNGIDLIYSKLIKFTGIFYKLRCFLCPEILKMLYFAFVHSHILYYINKKYFRL